MADRTRWRIDAVRRDVHQRLGKKFPECVERALPEGGDRSFCRDASHAVEMLLVSESSLGQQFREQLVGDEKADVDFIQKTRALAHYRKPEKVLRAAASLYAEYSFRSTYGVNRRENLIERRNSGAKQLWKKFAQEVNADKAVEDWSKVEYCTEECAHVVNGLALGAFLRFIRSGFSQPVEKDDETRHVWKTLSQLRKRAPKTAEQWLSVVASLADGYSLCVVISDMSASGAPMVYVNQEFCRITGYKHSEACGRNCRFLQGPGTECDAVDILRSTLANREGSHVLMTNYRKNMEPFPNLLTMTPVFDSNGDYRFVVAVQFEVETGQQLTPAVARRRLVRLGRFLQQLPVVLPYPSSQHATRCMSKTRICDSSKMSADDFLAKRMASLSANYDGPDASLQRYSNVWLTRCSWLVRGPEIVSALVDTIGEDTRVAAVLRDFVRDSCPDVAAKLLDLVGVTDIVLEARGKLTEAQ